MGGRLITHELLGYPISTEMSPACCQSLENLVTPSVSRKMMPLEKERRQRAQRNTGTNRLSRFSSRPHY
ncbi:hypothetical protein FOZ60_002215 [Perkinsus olseni]|uniref:Uncharacterized protein n=1 Tax=Perkinsus olseni TaxID=32597 RepID=A0A7J6UA75_PEROL|nr:hypothetical protein FOZ60_002215 [Perkinsus olseni]KAF4753881.1 hypothetical protein FOZ62_031503 [Perkinsus olseni]